MCKSYKASRLKSDVRLVFIHYGQKHLCKSLGENEEELVYQVLSFLDGNWLEKHRKSAGQNKFIHPSAHLNENIFNWSRLSIKTIFETKITHPIKTNIEILFIKNFWLWPVACQRVCLGKRKFSFELIKYMVFSCCKIHKRWEMAAVRMKMTTMDRWKNRR